MHRMKHYFAPMMAALLAAAVAGSAQEAPNTITFVNRSGENALVKLVGPAGERVSVPKGENRTVHVEAGRYYMLVRYGDGAGTYSYSKGATFAVTQTADQYSRISITLHKVANGNYSSRPSSRNEFESGH